MPPRRSGRLPKHTEKAAENSGAGAKSSQPKRGKKRAASANVDGNKKMQKKAIDGRDIDTFCWICHKNGQDMICNSCPRVFHTECLKKSRSKINSSGICYECQAVSVSGNNNIPKISRNVLKNLLLISMQEVLKEDGKKSSKVQTPENSKFCRYFKTWPQGADNGYLCYLVDLDIIIDKINNDPPYSSIAEFFGDIKWLYHNCYILYGTDSERTETAQKLLKNFKQELLDMEACPECYSNKHSEEHLPVDFFTRVCQEPHDIVWAKLRGSPYWPAKVLQIYNGHADIRFFGTHDKSVVPLNQCFRISQESPYGKVVKRPNYKDALNELNIYVKNYENRFGNFYFYPDRTPLENTQKKDHSKRGRQRVSTEHSGVPDAADKVAVEEPMNANTSNSFSAPCISNNNQGNDLTAAVTSPDQDPISVCMTFTADEESASLNHQAELIGESALDNSFPQNFAHSIATSISGSAEYTSNESSFKDLQPCVDSVTDCSSNFINSEGNTGPCIESVSNCANYSFSSQENLSSNAGEVTSDNSDQVINHSDALTASNADQGTSHYCNQVIPSCSNQEASNSQLSLDRPPSVSSFFNKLAQNLNRRYNSDEDTEGIQIILEKISENKIVTDLLKHKKLTDALIQRLLRHHPEWKRAYNEMNMFMKGMFLQMWLAIEQVTIEERAIKAFAAVYEEERKKREELEKENDLLKQELELMKISVDELKEQVEQKRLEREANRDLIIRALYRRINLHSKRLLDKLIQHMMENGSYQSNGSLLEDPGSHVDCLRQIVEKDRELKVCQSDVKQLREKFKDICKVENDQTQNVKSETQSVESETQTVLSVSPDNISCSLTEVKEEEIKEKVLSSKIVDAQETISCVENKKSDNAEDSKVENKKSEDSQVENKNSANAEDSQCKKTKISRTESFPWEEDAITYEEETVVRTHEVLMPICAVPSMSGICPSGIPPVSYSVMVSTSMDVSSSVITTQRNDVMDDVMAANEE